MRLRFVVLILALFALVTPSAAASRLVVWAWERPEDLRFVEPDIEVAAQVGFVVLSGAAVYARGRRFPLLVARRPTTILVHVQIDHRRTLAWTRIQRAEAAQDVLRLARLQDGQSLQMDFEVRRSERRVLLDLLRDVRSGLRPGVRLSMTALASWCDTETWIRQAPVDEIVPMLFRMGPGGEALLDRVESGGDFFNPRCRSALAVSTDAVPRHAPDGRRIYVFDPHSWTAAVYALTRRKVQAWTASHD